MGLIIDIFILCILFLSTYLGYKRGFIKVATSFLSFFIAIIVTFLFYRPLAVQITNTTTLDDKVYQLIYEKIQNSSQNDSNTFSEYINNFINDYNDASSDYIASSLTTTIIEGIAFIILFLVVKLVSLIFNFIFDFISELPIIKQFNKSGGLVYGIFRGIIFIYIVFALIFLMIPLYENMDILNYINDSYLGKFFYEHNFIVKTLLK